MNEASRGNDRSLPLEEALHIDRLCDAFEDALAEGRGPCIEDHLAGLPEPACGVLLRHLVALEVAYRQERGETPFPEEYRERFPEHIELIRGAFADAQPGEQRASCKRLNHKGGRRRDTGIDSPQTGPELPAPESEESSTTSIPPPDLSSMFPVESFQDVAAECATSIPPPDLPSIPGHEVLAMLGRGGMGVVYKARHLRLERLVALKMILAGDLAEPEHVARFLTEARAVARLQHPNIVQIHEIGEQDGRHYFSMEFINGGSLDKALAGIPQPPDEAAQLTETLARAMHVAHERGIVHRDLKPANVLLTADGTPKITDFGLAKQLDEEVGRTRTGLIMGTPSYMPPEQAEGKRWKIGPKADVYALGAILYELLTGRPPFGGANALEIVRQVLDDEPVAPSRLRPHVPRDLETICLKCLQKAPEERYVDAAALADDLSGFLKGEAIKARRVGHVERMLKWARRHPVSVLVALVLGLGGVGGTMAWLWLRAAGARQQLAVALDGEKQAQEKYRQLMYCRAVDLAYRDWKETNLGRADQLLANCPADLRCWEWYHVFHLCHTDLLMVKSPHSSVRGVAFSPDGKRLAGGSWDGEVKVWDAASGAMDLVLSSRSRGAVESVAFSPDGRRLAGASHDKTVKVWDLASRQEILTLTGHTGGVNSVAFSHDGRHLASASWDETVKIWDVARGQKIRTLKGPAGPVYSVAFSPDGKCLASASYDGPVMLWDLAGGQETRTLKGHTGAVWSVAFSLDGQRLASASDDTTVRVWDVAHGQVVTVKGHTGPVSSVAFNPDGQRLASASNGRAGGREHFNTKVTVWTAAAGQEALTLKGYTGAVWSVAFSPDGQRLASASNDMIVKVWDVARGQGILTLKGHTGPVRSVAFSPDGQRLASASDDGLVKLWDMAHGQEALTLKGHTGAVHSVAFSPDGQRLASASIDGTKVWDVARGQKALAFKHDSATWSVAFSPDGRRLASAKNNGATVTEMLEGAQDQKVLQLWGHTGRVKSVAFSPDGRRLVSASADGTVRVWDPASGEETLTLKGHTDSVESVAFSLDGQRLASACQDGTVKVWDAAAGLSFPQSAHAISSTIPRPRGHGPLLYPEIRLKLHPFSNLCPLVQRGEVTRGGHNKPMLTSLDPYQLHHGHPSAKRVGGQKSRGSGTVFVRKRCLVPDFLLPPKIEDATGQGQWALRSRVRDVAEGVLPAVLCQAMTRPRMARWHVGTLARGTVRHSLTLDGPTEPVSVWPSGQVTR